MKKAFDQTVRDIKREVNKKVLKVPGIEQKVLDATSNEPWGPHGALLADVAQATRNYHEYQMIMAVIWKRINDTGKNWRHVYKALTVLEYLVAHGSERVIDEIREHAYQISTLADFQYIDSSGRDQGSNVRKKSQSLVALVNDKERIIEVREKAAANRDKFRNTSTGGMYRPGSYSSSGGYGDRYDDDRYEGRHGSKDEDRNGYGREREYDYRDDRYGRYGDSYSRDGDRYGRDYEERYGRDGYREDDHRGRSRSVDDFQYGSRSRSSDRDRERGYDDDGQSSSRGSGVRADDHSYDGKRLERKFSEQNIGAPPSYEEAVSESRSPVHSERDGETSAPAAPRASSPPSHRPSQATTAAAANSASPGNQEVEAFDEFDPRGSVAAAPAVSNGSEVGLLGSLTESFSSNQLALVPAGMTSEADANVNSGSVPTYATQSATMNQSFEDPFGDTPFKAIPSTDTVPLPPQTSTSAAPFQPTVSQNAQIPHPAGQQAETVPNFGFGDSFSSLTYSAPTISDVQPPPSNSQFLPQELSPPNQDTDILADILPPTGPSPGVAPQPSFSVASQDLNSHAAFPAQLPAGASAAAFPGSASQPGQAGVIMYGGFHMQQGSVPAGVPNMAPQALPQSGGNYFHQGGSTAPAHSYVGPQTSSGSAAQFHSGNFLAQQVSAAPVASQFPHQAPTGPAAQNSNGGLPNLFSPAGSNASLLSQPSLPSSTGSLALVPQPTKDKFEPKSAVWADTLSRGLVNLNISGPKTNPLADIGVDFDAINRKEKRMEKQPASTQVTSTVTMGKAMGSGSGIGRAGAGALRPLSNPMMGSGMGMGMGPGIGGMGMGGYGGGTNYPMGMGMGSGMGMNMGMAQGVQMQPQAGMPPGSTMPPGYNTMMGTGGYGHQPYGGGYR